MSARKERVIAFLDDVMDYLDFQREIYGNEIYYNVDFEEIALPAAERKAQMLDACYEKMKSCSKCGLAASRHHVVYGAGNPDARLVLIGEAPGREEDLQGKPFVGAAGQLLTKILKAINLSRDDVYISNILKCRPPQNRDPLPEEQDACFGYLRKQIEIIQPEFILAMGRIASHYMLKTSKSMGELRGVIHDYENIKLIVTYHPAALLRNEGLKRDTWEDVQKLQKLYEGSRD